MDENYLSNEEAAEYCGQSRASWFRNGRKHVPSVKVGDTIRFRKSDLAAYIAKPGDLPLRYQPTLDLVNIIHLIAPTIQHATAQLVSTDFVCWLIEVGFTGGKQVEKIFELIPDIESAVARNDNTALMLVFDGTAVRLHVSDDHLKLAEIAMNERDDGCRVAVSVPQEIRDWLRAGGRYADA